MEREPFVIATTERGRIAIAPDAIAEIVEGLAVDPRVVAEHGLKLAEVAETVRSRVQYELERIVGLPIASLEVHIEGVRSR